MTRLSFPALTADSVLGFLAALGTLRLLTQELNDPDARLGWPSGPYAGAEVLSERFSTIEELADAIGAIVDGMKAAKQLLPGVIGFPPTGDDSTSDPTGKLTLADSRGLASSHDPGLARWLQAVVAMVPPMDRKTGLAGTLEKGRFLKAGPGTVWVPRTLAGVLNVLDPTSIIEAFSGWRRRDGFIGAYLDQRADIESATGQGSKSPPKRGVPGATFLALMALPLVPSRTPGQFATETVGWSASRKIPKGFAWPVWSAPMSIDSVTALLDHPLVAKAVRENDESSKDRLQALGLSAVFRSVRVGAGNNDAAMAPASVVWAAG